MRLHDMTRSIFILLGIFGLFLIVLYFTLHKQIPETSPHSHEKNYKFTMEYKIDISNGINGTVSVDIINYGDNISDLMVYLKTPDLILVNPVNITSNITTGETKTFFFAIEPGIENGVFMLKKGYMDDEITVIAKSEEGNITLKGSRKLAVCEEINKTFDCDPDVLKINTTTEIFENYANIVLYLKNIFKQKSMENVLIRIDVPENISVNPTMRIIDKIDPGSTEKLGILVTPKNQRTLSSEHEPNTEISVNITYMNNTRTVKIPLAVCQKINEEIIC